MNVYCPLSEYFITGDGDEGCTEEEVLEPRNVTTYVPKLSPSRFQAKSDNLVHPDQSKVCVTVELPNNGHIGSGPFVLYIEVVPL